MDPAWSIVQVPDQREFARSTGMWGASGPVAPGSPLAPVSRGSVGGPGTRKLGIRFPANGTT